jgi:ribosome-binding protein aMBF1 (putative translation factor)
MLCRICKTPITKTGAVDGAPTDLCERCARGRTHKLGDKVAILAQIVGARKTPDCGCARRQAALNDVDLKQRPKQVAKEILQALGFNKRP